MVNFVLCNNSFARGIIGALFTGGKKRCDKQKFVTIAKPCFAHSRNCSIAQGTIEYLVVVGVIVVLSLVIVALIVNLSSAPSQQILSESEKLGGLGGGGIVIVDAVSDFDESGFVVLRNYSGSDLSLTKIKVDDNSYAYSNEFIGSTREEIFNIKDLCVCGEGERNRTCEFEFFYLTQSGLEKKESKSVTVNCASGVSGGGKVVEPILPEPNGGTPPVISLTPVYYSVGKSVDFEFEVDAEKDISSCTLFVGDDSNTYYNISDGSNTINYTFLTDKLVDYNISCVDNSNNVGYSDSLTINVDSNSFQITTCVELQDMNKNLGGHYELMNNIDCYDDTREGGVLFNEGLGFKPVGTNINNVFLGSLNGNGKKIIGLNINLLGGNYVGLFGYSSGIVSNLGLVDVNIKGNQAVGAIVGVQNEGSLYNVYSTGDVNGFSSMDSMFVGGIVGLSNNSSLRKSYSIAKINGAKYVGGLVGGLSGSSGVISESYSLSDINGYVYYIGGLVGYQSDEGVISDSYSKSNLIGFSNNENLSIMGGLVGYLKKGVISNSYSVGKVSGQNQGVGGFVGLQENGSMINNSYSATTVEGTDFVGAFIGSQNSGLTNNVYFDASKSGYDYCCGGGYCLNCVGKNFSNSEMDAFFPKLELNGYYNVPMQNNVDLVNDWDFGDIWKLMDDDYPIFYWQD